MAQYYPAGKVGETEYTEINRRITSKEYQVALEAAHSVGLRRLDNHAPLRYSMPCQ
jgi:uncharacterized Fe-S radical SAM superfamily protein PflX